MKLENNVKILGMAVKQRTLKISHASALVDKNANIYTVKKELRETVKKYPNLKKYVMVAMKNVNSNEKLAERRRHMIWTDMFSISKMSWSIQETKQTIFRWRS